MINPRPDHNLRGSAHCAPTGELCFLPEKACFQKLLQVACHQCLTGHWPLLRKRTDSKKGSFFEPFGRKWRVGALKKAFYFALFHVLVVFTAWKLLSVKFFRHFGAFPKNRAEKPTVGF